MNDIEKGKYFIAHSLCKLAPLQITTVEEDGITSLFSHGAKIGIIKDYVIYLLDESGTFVKVEDEVFEYSNGLILEATRAWRIASTINNV